MPKFKSVVLRYERNADSIYFNKNIKTKQSKKWKKKNRKQLLIENKPVEILLKCFVVLTTNERLHTHTDVQQRPARTFTDNYLMIIPIFTHFNFLCSRFLLLLMDSLCISYNLA